MKTFIILFSTFLIFGCAARLNSNPGFSIGSTTSKNLFIDSSQFSNRTIKLRIRNSSGDPDFDLSRFRNSIENGFRSAGYSISDQNYGIIVDVNAFQFQSVSRANISTSRGLGLLLGGVAGYELSKRSDNISSASGIILGAIAGSSLEEIVRYHGETWTYIALCDVNIGIIRMKNVEKDRFIIGGNKIEYPLSDDVDTYTNFAYKDTIRIAAYAGDDPSRSRQTIDALLDRLGRIVGNLL